MNYRLGIFAFLLMSGGCADHDSSTSPDVKIDASLASKPEAKVSAAAPSSSPAQAALPIGLARAADPNDIGEIKVTYQAKPLGLAWSAAQSAPATVTKTDTASPPGRPHSHDD